MRSPLTKYPLVALENNSRAVLCHDLQLIAVEHFGCTRLKPACLAIGFFELFHLYGIRYLFGYGKGTEAL